MEEEKYSGNVLKQALQKRQTGKLPSNFTYRMMEQIRVEAQKQEKRKRRILLLSLLVALSMIIGSFIFCIFFYLDFKPTDLLRHFEFSPVFSPLVGFYSYISLLALCLLGIDYWIRKKRQSINDFPK